MGKGMGGGLGEGRGGGFPLKPRRDFDRDLDPLSWHGSWREWKRPRALRCPWHSPLPRPFVVSRLFRG